MIAATSTAHENAPAQPIGHKQREATGHYQNGRRKHARRAGQYRAQKNNAAPVQGPSNQTLTIARTPTSPPLCQRKVTYHRFLFEPTRWLGVTGLGGDKQTTRSRPTAAIGGFMPDGAPVEHVETPVPTSFGSRRPADTATTKTTAGGRERRPTAG